MKYEQIKQVNVIKKRIKDKSVFSKIIAWLHLWPSIVSGIILVFVSFTGTLIVYCDEIIDLSAGEAKYVTAKGHKLPLEDILEIHKKNFPHLFPSYVIYHQNPNRSIAINTFDPKLVALSMVYIDPYTGKMLKHDKTIHTFFVLAHLHAQLLLQKTGGWIVGIATVIFVLSTLTGLVLWWPKRWTKVSRKASFTIKWKARFKRLNYDIHNVYGFYSLIICFILGTTGLIIFFQPLMNTTIEALGGTAEEWHDRLPKADSTRTVFDANPLIEKTFKQFPEKKIIKYWVYDYDKSGTYSFIVADRSGLKSDENRASIYYNKYTGARIWTTAKEKKHDQVENMIWQLHMGQWFGQLGKFSTFLAGIVATSLPITGFLIWWGRRRKKNRSQEAKKNYYSS